MLVRTPFLLVGWSFSGGQVYQGCHAQFRPLDLEIVIDRLRADYGINPPFPFYVGGSDFRKNLERFIEAYYRIRKLGFEGKLVKGGETFRWDIFETAFLRKKNRTRFDGLDQVPRVRS